LKQIKKNVSAEKSYKEKSCGNFGKKDITGTYKNLHTNVYSSFVIAKPIKMSFSR
jgi:hypothetical protein